MMNTLLNLLYGWKELTVTTNEQVYYKIKDQLAANHLKYQTNIVDQQSINRKRGTLLGNHHQKMYYIYVKKNTYNAAVHFIRQ
ncbi:hypothetical protein KHM83_15435 [Fusibacter paucivorans]|uniref:Uncharacterized protein n=1 Tax=Fusibacter paucivorans TaxID=76009 RepID=A0ABS5PSK5_9FIRM|nr:hypothetical protein [Fusibacter paucivorans]MBS7528078.1 hypothetical protein [Fusibacter paucivorans]